MEHGCPQGKALLVFHHGGRVCVGMGRAGFLGKWGGEREGKNNGKNDLKSSSSLPLHVQ